MTETSGVGLMIFMGLNVAAVGFLAYCLVQFWKEEHESKGSGRPRGRMSGYAAGPEVMVAILPQSASTRRQNDRLIQFPAQGGSGQRRGETNNLADRTHKTSRSAVR